MSKKVYEITEEEIILYYRNHNSILMNEQNEERIENNEYHDEDNEKKYRKYISRLNLHIKYLMKEIDSTFMSMYLPYETHIRKPRFQKLKPISQPFLNSRFDIFISHSHKDIKDIIKFSKDILFKFNKESFIDSKYWNHKDNVIDKNVRELCDIKPYNNCNIIRLNSYVQDIINMYLTDALQYQMLSSQIIIQVITKNYNLESPWIYFENRVVDYFCKINNCKRIKISIGEFLNLPLL